MSAGSASPVTVVESSAAHARPAVSNLVSDVLGQGRVIVVSNRLPISVGLDGRGELVVKDSVGGVATALARCFPPEQRKWIGWPGDLTRLAPRQVSLVEHECAARSLVPVRLTRKDVERYYEGCSNGVLWPVFHNRIDRLPQGDHEFDTYRAVNDRFAEVAHHAAGDDDVIWVHDFHLFLVPAMVRQRRPRGRIAFFLHIPFPPLEVFSVLPDRREILDGILGSDVVGFHTERFRDRFLECVKALVNDAEVDLERGTITLSGEGGRVVSAVCVPLGVDAADFAGPGDEAVAREMAELRAFDPELKILLGVDRLDYTKGIPRRLLAMEALLEQNPELRGKVTLVQIAVPSRENVEAYAELKRQVQQIVGRVNGQYSTLSGAVPIRLLTYGYGQHELLSLYRAADVMVVSPLLDGMNLVAKEFVAARTDGDGVLVLSEFAGAADALKDALQVNPYDLEGTARTLLRAVRMDKDERRLRMHRLRACVEDESPRRWAEQLLARLPPPEAERAA